jgi:hypothetical protein
MISAEAPSELHTLGPQRLAQFAAHNHRASAQEVHLVHLVGRRCRLDGGRGQPSKRASPKKLEQTAYGTRPQACKFCSGGSWMGGPSKQALITKRGSSPPLTSVLPHAPPRLTPGARDPPRGIDVWKSRRVWAIWHSGYCLGCTTCPGGPCPRRINENDFVSS